MFLRSTASVVTRFRFSAVSRIMAWHGTNEFAEAAPTAPVSKSPRPLSEVIHYTKLALMVCISQTWNVI